MSIMPSIVLVVLEIFLISLYLLPSIIALIKRNRRTKVIIFNIFLGWTVVLWILCMVWACKREEPEMVSDISSFSAATVSTPTVSTIKYCPQCGATLKYTDKFCSHCGAKFDC